MRDAHDQKSWRPSWYFWRYSYKSHVRQKKCSIRSILYMRSLRNNWSLLDAKWIRYEEFLPWADTAHPDKSDPCTPVNPANILSYTKMLFFHLYFFVESNQKRKKKKKRKNEIYRKHFDPFQFSFPWQNFLDSLGHLLKVKNITS